MLSLPRPCNEQPRPHGYMARDAETLLDDLYAMDIESLVDRLARRNALIIRLVRWYRRLHPTRPHGFTINAFIVDGVTQPVPAPYFPILLGSWRLMACLIFCNSIVVYSFIFYSVWSSPSLVITSVLIVQIIAFIFRTLGIGSGTFTIGSLLSSVGHYYILAHSSEKATSCLVLVSKVSSFWPSIWSYFWFTYCLFAIRRRRFSQNYHEAWKLKHPGHFIPVFIGRSDCVRIPLPGPDEPGMDDLHMWKHLSFFYRLYRIEGGFSQVLLPKALVRFEIVEITDDIYKGPLVAVFDVPQRILRLVESETPISVPAGHDPRRDIRELRRASVYRDLAQADSLKGLRFVVGWDTTLISIVVLLPTIISIATVVAWPIVAVLKYEADVQTSVQTGATVGSFIVTAGALLIGLVTLFDALTKHLWTTQDQLELTTYVKVQESLNGEIMSDQIRLPDSQAYTIGWIAALDKELTAALAMLDERHQQPENFIQNQRDTNSYSWGCIGAHNVIIASLAEGSYGLVSAATTATSMILSLPHIRFGLMVGIGAGIPRLEDGVDIRLGDVVVSQPIDGSSGVVQYDLGKLKAHGEFQRVGSLAPPPAVLLKGLTKLKADRRLNGSQLPRILADALKLFPRLAKPRGKDAAFIHQGLQNDRLFAASSIHMQVMDVQRPLYSKKQVLMKLAKLSYHHLYNLTVCIWGMIMFLFFSQWRSIKNRSDAELDTKSQAGEASLQSITKTETCVHCNPEDELTRDNRPDTDPEIHYGAIASGNSIVKDSISRDQILQKLETKCLCFEMEAAGLMNDFPCLVIRGVCDYADSHKNDRWQNYAAIVAAAYAKELLLVMEATNVVQTKEIGEIIGIVSQIEATMKDTHREVQELSAGDRFDKLRSWLSAPDPSIDQNKATNLHHSGTCQWFLESPKYLQWKTESRSAMWLHGLPGCGKTILSSRIITDLQHSGLVCLYFYFTFTDAKKQSMDMAVRSLMCQLYCQSKPAEVYLNSVFDSRANNLAQPDTNCLCSWFEAMVKETGEVWIVLDALDEWDTNHECQEGQALKNKGLLPWIKTILKSWESNFHIIFTSRDEKNIRKALEAIPENMQISVRNKHVDADIQSFIQTTIATWDDLCEWKDDQTSRQKVEKHLISHADGMFRWVFCQLVTLKDCCDGEQLQETLANLPKTLDETYARILDKIPGPHPLILEEAIDINALPIRELQPRPKFDFPAGSRKADISEYCPCLVVSVTATNQFNGKTTNIVQLSHFSVKEYLLCDRVDPDISQAFDERIAKTSMAKTCLSYLLDMDHSLPPMNLQSSYPLAPYAAQYWARYAAQADCSSISTLIQEFLNHKDCYRTCYKLFDFDGEHEQRDWLAFRQQLRRYHPDFDHEEERERRSTFWEHLSNYSHEDRFENPEDDDGDWTILRYSFRHLLRMYNPEFDHQDKETRRSVFWQLLRDYNPDFDDGRQSRRSLMIWWRQQKRNGFRFVPKQGWSSQSLVRHGLRANDFESEEEDGYASIYLQWQLEGCCHVIESREEDSDGPASRYGPRANDPGLAPHLLYFCASEGLVSAVEILIDLGADVNDQGGRYGNALLVASSHGHESIVQLLIGKGGADVNAYSKGVKYATALWAAVSNGHSRVAEALLQAGAVSGSYFDDRDIIAHAVDVGHKALVETLLRNGVKVSELALSKASANGFYEICAMLLKKIPDADAAEYCGEALIEASRSGQYDIAQMLITRGADTDLMGGDWRSALNWAVLSGHERVCKLLICHGASFTGYNYSDHPLFNGSKAEIIRLLPLHEVQSNIMHESIYSSFRNSKDHVVKELLDYFGLNRSKMSHRVLKNALIKAIRTQWMMTESACFTRCFY
ncbi:pfs domain-containing protein [Colletotrichum fioriniae PJ7]|uniref:Pfs domain-containing protein n=1 Tax=Colletotrichum fioriniae PJ7 TaxID=1445577 RepID=A0A010QCI6_9PEZI|nr:pfs domain-containing protein [Colletotrichum fioriniae PJ7]